MYPALSVLQAIENNPDFSLENLLWVGGEGGMEKELVERAGIEYADIPAAGVHGVGLATLPGNILQLLKGFSRARTLLRRFRPDVMFFTGGYVAVPVALAGITIPSVLYVPDIEPGLALKTLAFFANEIALTTETSQSYFSPQKRVSLTGYPTRPGLEKWTQDEARRAFDLEEDLPTLLVFGGSKGARSINRALLPHLPDLLSEMQIIHISGHLDWEEVQGVQEKLSPEQQERYRAFAYLHEKMGAALRVADLVLSRAGASALGEFPLFGLPAILVPYPYAWRYQKVNAQFLAERGAAIMVRDEELPARVLPLVRDLMGNPARRKKMSEAMHQLARPLAAQAIAQVLMKHGR